MYTGREPRSERAIGSVNPTTPPSPLVKYFIIVIIIIVTETYNNIGGSQPVSKQGIIKVIQLRQMKLILKIFSSI